MCVCIYEICVYKIIIIFCTAEGGYPPNALSLKSEHLKNYNLHSHDTNCPQMSEQQQHDETAVTIKLQQCQQKEKCGSYLKEEAMKLCTYNKAKS